MPINAACLRECIRKKILWFVGGTLIAALAGFLMALGVLFPGIGTVAAILVLLGILLFISATAVISCMIACNK